MTYLNTNVNIYSDKFKTDGKPHHYQDPEYNPLDMDNNGKIDAADLSLYNGVLEMYKNEPKLLSPDELKEVDINGDGKFDDKDLNIFDNYIKQQDAININNKFKTDGKPHHYQDPEYNPLDMDNNGKIDAADLSLYNGVLEMYKNDPKLLSPDELKELDINSDGKFDDNDLKTFANHLKAEALVNKFKTDGKPHHYQDPEYNPLDMDNNGKIDATDLTVYNEVLEMYKNDPKLLNPDEVKELDINSDGKFDDKDLNIFDIYVKQKDAVKINNKFKTDGKPHQIGEPGYNPLDINNSGNIDATDLKYYEMLLKISTDNPGLLKPNMIQALDINSDGKFDDNDLNIFRQVVNKGYYAV